MRAARAPRRPRRSPRRRRSAGTNASASASDATGRSQTRSTSASPRHRGVRHPRGRRRLSSPRARAACASSEHREEIDGQPGLLAPRGRRRRRAGALRPRSPESTTGCRSSPAPAASRPTCPASAARPSAATRLLDRRLRRVHRAVPRPRRGRSRPPGRARLGRASALAFAQRRPSGCERLVVDQRGPAACPATAGTGSRAIWRTRVVGEMVMGATTRSMRVGPARRTSTPGPLPRDASTRSGPRSTRAPSARS